MIPLYRFRDAAWMVGCVAAMGVVLAVVLGISRLNSLADDNKALGEQNRALIKAVADQQDGIERAANAAVETNERLLDCLDTDGDCAKQTAANQADTVAGLNEITFYSVACSPLLDGTENPEQAYRVISACVADLRERLTGGKQQ